MPDFSQPGSDGILPDGFAIWGRGVTYTLWRDLPSLAHGRECRINATVRRIIPRAEPFTGYGALYHQCEAILAARTTELARVNGIDAIHTWVESQAWWSGAVADKYPGSSDRTVACASMTMGLVHRRKGDLTPQGQAAPEPAQLTKPSGTIAESSHLDELYIDFDFNDPSAAGTDVRSPTANKPITAGPPTSSRLYNAPKD